MQLQFYLPGPHVLSLTRFDALPVNQLILPSATWHNLAQPVELSPGNDVDGPLDCSI